jgi:hypothetical protein
MRREWFAVVMLAVAGCGGPGGDRETFCAAVTDHGSGEQGAMARMIDNAPDAIRESLELMNDGTSDPATVEAARGAVNEFIRNKCQLGVTV